MDSFEGDNSWVCLRSGNRRAEGSNAEGRQIVEIRHVPDAHREMTASGLHWGPVMVVRKKNAESSETGKNHEPELKEEVL